MKLLISVNIKNDEDDNFKGFHIYETNIQFRFHSISTTVNLVIATSQFVFSLQTVIYQGLLFC